MLSTLLFWHDNPHPGDTYNDKEHTFTMCRTQRDIEQQSCNQIDVKTIHDTAVPFLCLFGYLTIKEKMNGNLYTLHMDRINAAYAVWDDPEALRAFLKSSLQLESAPIKIAEDELELTLINKSRLYLQLERVLIAIGKDSNCRRGRKPRDQVPSGGKKKPLETIETSRDIYRENDREKDQSSDPSLFFQSSEGSENAPTVKPPDNDALAQEHLLQWIKELRIPRAKDRDKLSKDVKFLLPAIHSKEQLERYYAYAKEQFEGIVWLGNLASENLLNAWLQTEEPPQDAIDTRSSNIIQIGFNRENCDRLIEDNILMLYPEFANTIEVDDSNAPVYFIGIALGNNRWIDIEKEQDWWDLDKELIKQAQQYSTWLLKKEDQKRKLQSKATEEIVVSV
jgi:hypothetical protein